MANNRVILKKSSVASKVPTTSDLEFGELAVNYTDGKIYYKDSSNNIRFFEETNSFQNVDVSGQTTLTADGGSDTLTFVEGQGITITTDETTNELTITASGSSGNDFVDSLSFNTTDGILTAGRSGTLSDLTVDLNGRFLLQSAKAADADLLDGQDSAHYLDYNNLTNIPETAVTSDTAPSSPDDGDLWWDTSLGQLFVYYDDGTTAQWVEASPAAGSVENTSPNNTLITLDAGNGLSGGGDFTTNQESAETITFSVDANAIGTDELNVSGTGTSGQALLSNGDGSLSFGAAGADITDDITTNSDFYLTLTDSTSGSFTTATISSSRLYFNPSTGTLNSTEYNSLSDKSLKKNIDTINNGIDVINQIRPVSFEWKDTDKSSFGVIAQEIEKILPEIVETNDEGTKSVAYNKIIAFLIDAVKTLDERTRN